MNVREIVAAHLNEHGYDGLYDGTGCSCFTDTAEDAGDLLECCAYLSGCKPGYKTADGNFIQETKP